MIALIAASAMYLAASQAAISAGTMSFKDCLRNASTKAKSEKVAAGAYEAYARNACGAELAKLTSVLVAFDLKNGMSKKTAAEDAAATAGDYLASSVDKYTYLAGLDAQDSKQVQAADASKAAAALKPATVAVPASAPTTPK